MRTRWKLLVAAAVVLVGGVVAVLVVPGGPEAVLSLVSPDDDEPTPETASELPTGSLVVHIRDAAGQPVAARLTFIGVKGTHTPAFTHGDIGRDQPGGVLAYDRAFITGDATLDVPHGTYDVTVSHGPEWDVVTREVTIGAGPPAVLEVVLAHVVDTPGWISGDFHVHADPSPDSKVPMRHRALQFVADGVDLIVSTDHDVVADYAPIIAQLGVSDRLASIRGDELTTHDWGHFGAFPLETDVPVAGRTPAEFFAQIRHDAPDAVIDIHHPRLEKGRIGYFHLGELDLATMHARRPGFSFDFDAVEVLNGYQDPDRSSVDAVLSDWFALLRRGHHAAATGNSDSHHLTFNLGGYPRNYVQLPDDSLTHLDPVAVARAVKAGRSFFTTGPIVDVRIGDKGLGDIVTARRLVNLHVTVRAPAWMDVDKVTVLVDGVPALHKRVEGVAVKRFDETIAVAVQRDTFIVVRVDGDRPMAPMVGDGAKFRVFPLAVTNPIWIDVDGDGRITPSESPLERAMHRRSED